MGHSHNDMIPRYMQLSSLHDMCSVVSIDALNPESWAGRRAHCTEPTCGKAVKYSVVEVAERGMDELLTNESPTRSTTHNSLNAS